MWVARAYAGLATGRLPSTTGMYFLTPALAHPFGQQRFDLEPDEVVVAEHLRGQPVRGHDATVGVGDDPRIGGGVEQVDGRESTEHVGAGHAPTFPRRGCSRQRERSSASPSSVRKQRTVITMTRCRRLPTSVNRSMCAGMS